ARYPDEMTIVIQHQFWGLEVDEVQFAVTLSFNRMNERLVIPFAAVTAFADPSAKFELQFQGHASEGGAGEADPGPVPAAPASNEADGEDAEDKADEAERGQVIALDAFRKK